MTHINDRKKLRSLELIGSISTPLYQNNGMISQGVSVVSGF
nr:MAG TPA: hypothetical protein [Caudoviricetes sp.]